MVSRARSAQPPSDGYNQPPSDGYKWTALFISTLGMLMANIDSSIVLISMPDIFRGIGIDPLQSRNSFFLLWMILGFMVVTSVLVVTLGRLGDIYGRVRTYNFGFAGFTFFSLLLAITWMSGDAAGIWLIVMRIFQGVGAAMLLANSAAILTDAFPPRQRGMALGINQTAGISGVFLGLILGGVLAPINWRLVFLVNVPIGLFATIWGYLELRELGERRHARVDWPGNITFAVGMVMIMVGITYGIEPYGGHNVGWANPLVYGLISGGVVVMVAFCVIETKVPEPMFHLQLFRIRAFSAGVFASFLGSLSRGGIMFLLIIWLQGIWLPLHGYDFSQTPFWAGLALIPLTLGMLLSGPTSGILSDRFGARPFATGGMIGVAVCLGLLELLPVNFNYWAFAVLLFFTGICMSMFGSPNRTGVMNSLPAEHRGAGSGMNATCQNSASVFSMGIFFSLIILGLSASLSHNLFLGLTAHGVPTAAAHQAAGLPPISTLFAAILGYNPMQHLLGATTLSHLTAAQQSTLLGNSFFSTLIVSPFRSGLHAALDFGIIVSLGAAAASWTRGGRYVHAEPRGGTVPPSAHGGSLNPNRCLS
jgi:MFS family permease